MGVLKNKTIYFSTLISIREDLAKESKIALNVLASFTMERP